jgi:hypothetical protein
MAQVAAERELVIVQVTSVGMHFFVRAVYLAKENGQQHKAKAGGAVNKTSRPWVNHGGHPHWENDLSICQPLRHVDNRQDRH